MSVGVRFAVDGRVGRIILDRPKAIHALTLAMCEAMTAQLVAWAGDDRVALVIVEHGEGRGFCAGGDVRFLSAEGAADGSDARAFFHAEYRLNHLMFVYPKPIVSFMDGITMGGGVGIAAPARYRIATENTIWAMPETGIGMFTDIGGGWFLSRLEGALGAFLALTGARLDAAETLALGLATHHVPADALPVLKAAIVADPAATDRLLAEAATIPPPARIERNRERIDRLFGQKRYEDIVAGLAEDPSDWAAKELKTLQAKSPSACKISLELIRRGATRSDFAEEMAAEYALATRVAVAPDFREGVRALLIDKDNRPHWRPPSPEAVTDEMIAALFAPLSADEAWTPEPL
jgi:enoyl-CoA hydratase